MTTSTMSTGITKARRREIEDEATSLLVTLWRKNRPDHPLDAISPGMALEHLGFHVGSQDLGIELIEGQLVQVAGQIDFERKEVWLSTRPTRDEQFFTAAHELGHAVLHPGQNGLHRDRPLKGPAARKDSKEAEADYFASCFLMPRKQVVKSFESIFGTDRFLLNQASASALCDSSVSQLRQHLRRPRDLSRLLVECTKFNGVPVTALKYEYQVSTEAMAIRIEELGLVGNFSLTTRGPT